jgi:DNA topoisomerase IB
MDWNKYFSYDNGKLIRKPKVVTKPHDKMYNTQHAGKVVGSLDNYGYMVTSLHNKNYKVHRIIWEMHNGITNDKVIHHINSNKLDNRLENLALVTSKQNTQKYDASGKGYRVHADGMFRAQRMHNGVALKLKQYGTKCGAIMASRTALI